MILFLMISGVHYRDRLVYENIFKNDDIEYSWVWGDWLKDFRSTLPLLSSLFSDQETYFINVL